MNGRRVWLSGVLAAALFWTALFALGAARAGYSHFTDAVSELGAVGLPHALTWNLVGFIVPGLLLAACGAGIATSVDGRRGALWWLLTGSGVTFAGTGVFPAVVRDGSPMMQAPSTVGHVVMLLLSGVFWLIAVGVLLRGIRRSQGLSRLLVPYVVLTLVALVGFTANVFHEAIPPLMHRPGLAQRLGFVGYFLWYVLLSLRIAMLATRQRAVT